MTLFVLQFAEMEEKLELNSVMMEIQMEHQDATVFVPIRSLGGYVLEGQHFHQALVILFVETASSYQLRLVMMETLLI